MLGIWEFDPQASGLPNSFPLASETTVIDEYAVSIVAKLGDRVINRGVRRVAPDGKTMRVDVVSIDRDGKETSFFLVFNRTG